MKSQLFDGSVTVLADIDPFCTDFNRLIFQRLFYNVRCILLWIFFTTAYQTQSVSLPTHRLAGSCRYSTVWTSRHFFSSRLRQSRNFLTDEDSFHRQLGIWFCQQVYNILHVDDRKCLKNNVHRRHLLEPTSLCWCRFQSIPCQPLRQIPLFLNEVDCTKRNQISSLCQGHCRLSKRIFYTWTLSWMHIHPIQDKSQNDCINFRTGCAEFHIHQNVKQVILFFDVAIS